MTVKTLSPLSPIPPFWLMLTDEPPGPQFAPKTPIEILVGPDVAKSNAEERGPDVGPVDAEIPANSSIPDEEWASLEAQADHVEAVAKPIVTQSPQPEAMLQSAGEGGLDEATQEHVEWLLRVEAGRADAEPVTQSIPHADMMAGLLAASKIRPIALPASGNGKLEPLLTAEKKLGDSSVAQPSAVDNSRGWEITLPSVDQSDPWAAGIAHLQIMPPLDGFTMSQWRRVQHGCATLLASHGAEMRRLGWTAEDAFGIHPRVPAAGIHCYGLGLMLGDSQVVDMTERGARILLRSGVAQTFTRLPSPWAVPIWTVGGMARSRLATD